MAPVAAPAATDKAAGLTVKLSVPLVCVNGPVPVELSVTETVKVKVAGADGVPDSAQFAASVTPDGSDPLIGVVAQE